MTETKRASLEELLTFANKVRAAGGGNPLDALMPAVPQNTHTCLIAKNLNFNCEVRADVEMDNECRWVMSVPDRELAHRIATAIRQPVIEVAERILDYSVAWDQEKYPGPGYPYGLSKTSVYAVLLPREIGQIASDFDLAWDQYTEGYHSAFNKLARELVKYDDNHYPSLESGEKLEISMGPKYDAELLTLVEASEREAYSNATLVAEDGSIIL